MSDPLVITDGCWIRQ